METQRIVGSISLITRNMKVDGEVNGKENLKIEGKLAAGSKMFKVKMVE